MLSPMEELDKKAEDIKYKEMRQELIGIGLWEVGMSTHDMLAILEVVRDSKQSAEQEQSFRDAVKNSNGPEPEIKGVLKRRYIAATDQRLPWSILPQNLKLSQKKQVILKYWQAMSRTQHARAKFNVNFTPWPTPIDIPRETMSFRSLRATRSGRYVPVKYTNSDDDSEVDESATNRKIRKKRLAIVQNTNNLGKESTAEIQKITEKRKLPIEDSEVTPSVCPRRETKSSSPEIESITVEADIHRDDGYSPPKCPPIIFPPSPEDEEEENGCVNNSKRMKKKHSS